MGAYLADAARAAPGGTIILADAHIRYSQPISGRPSAIADLGSLSGDLDRLARGRKARVQMQVELFGDDKQGAVFEDSHRAAGEALWLVRRGRQRGRVSACGSYRPGDATRQAISRMASRAALLTPPS